MGEGEGMAMKHGDKKAMTLTDLANYYGSDKGSSVGAKHKYTPLYDFILRPFKDKKLRLLEIGLLRGGPELGFEASRKTTAPPSIQMWLDFLPKADVIGFDISDFARYQKKRFSFVQGDSSSADDLENLVKNCGPFDIVIDDASHASYHQLKAFLHIFRSMQSGGIYIIEDLHWQPPEIESACPECSQVRQVVEWAMGFADDTSLKLPPDLAEILNLKDSIAFCQGFAGFRTGLRGVKTAVFVKA